MEAPKFKRRKMFLLFVLLSFLFFYQRLLVFLLLGTSVTRREAEKSWNKNLLPLCFHIIGDIYVAHFFCQTNSNLTFNLYQKKQTSPMVPKFKQVELRAAYPLILQQWAQLFPQSSDVHCVLLNVSLHLQIEVDNKDGCNTYDSEEVSPADKDTWTGQNLTFNPLGLFTFNCRMHIVTPQSLWKWAQ